MPDSRSLLVLVVDDQPVLGAMVERMLQLGGHRAIVCPSAEAAIDVVAGDPSAIDVLLTDIHLGGMDGVDLANSLCRLRPGIAVVLTSGEAPGAELDRLPAACPARFLAKPYQRASINAAVEGAWRDAPRRSGDAPDGV